MVLTAQMSIVFVAFEIQMTICFRVIAGPRCCQTFCLGSQLDEVTNLGDILDTTTSDP